MPKVLVLANEYTTILHFRMELLHRLKQDGHEVILVLPPHDKNQSFKVQDWRVIEVSLNRFGMNPFQELRLLLQYVKVFSEEKPDIVLTYTAKPNIFGGLACRFMKVPYICNVTGLGANLQRESLVQRVLLFLQKVSFRRANRVFFQNTGNQCYFEQRGILPAGRVALLPGSGVNLALHRYETFPHGDDITRFAVVGRLRQDKGYDELFEAIRQVSLTNSKVEFRIAGWYEDERYKKGIDEMVSSFPVRYYGSISQEEVHELIASCHCLIHPSHHEGMANVLMEAAAAGRPCIASDIHGCKEAIDDEVTGFLFTVKSQVALTNAITRFLGLSRLQMESMGRSARAKMERSFDRKFVIERYADAIKEELETEK